MISQRHSREVLLDVSTLEPPEPLQRAVDAIETLEAGQYLRMLHRREPELLYPILNKLGFTHHTHPGTTSSFEILIWQRDDAEAEHACQRIIARTEQTSKLERASYEINSRGLSLEQAPPIGVPLQFILTAPVFGLLAAIILLVAGPDNWLSRWSPSMLAATHFITLGFLTMAMMGAMMQMLAVIVGSPIRQPQRMSMLIYAVYIPGILALGAGFLWNIPVLFRFASLTLAVAFGLFIITSLSSLQRTPVKTNTAKAMRLAIIALVITICIGVMLAATYGWETSPTNIRTLTSLHLGWGLLGWIGMLVMGVAYQVMPMFQMTPQYPALAMRWKAPLIFTLLILWTLSVLLSHSTTPNLNYLSQITEILLIATVCIYGVITLYLQSRRRRRLADVTVWFWRLAMYNLLAAAIIWLAMSLDILPDYSDTYELLMGVVILIGFTQSLINGMMYKIVPFLVWLHLQHQRATRGKIPNMKQIIPDRISQTQFWLHSGSLLLLVATVFRPQWFVYPASLLFAASQLLLMSNITRAWRTYRRIMKPVIS